jgi:hypothetical protein
MRNILASVALTLGLVVAIPAQADLWSCRYDGSWSTFSSANKGTFNWDVVWQSKAGGGWTINGDYADRYGESTLNGSCNNHACKLTQVYQTGELKGNKYYWNGKYTDKADGGGTINHFNGTWGSTPTADEGAWQAKAICTPQ